MRYLILFYYFIFFENIFVNTLESSKENLFTTTIKISESVPAKNCDIVNKNLKKLLTSANAAVSSITDGLIQWDTVNVIPPRSWTSDCFIGVKTQFSLGTSPDIVVSSPHPTLKDNIWTQQSRGCGQQGDVIHMSYKTLYEFKSISGQSLAEEWIKYAFGVFDEKGYVNDTIFPLCYYNQQQQYLTNACKKSSNSELCDIDSSGILNGQLPLKSSGSFNETTPSSVICDERTHNQYAPTKQNFLCDGRSIKDVIMSNNRFSVTEKKWNARQNLTIVYSTKQSNKLIIVIDDSREMNVSTKHDLSSRVYFDAWKRYLRPALRKWISMELPGNCHVGYVIVNANGVSHSHKLVGLDYGRETLVNSLPYSLSLSDSSGCLHCGLQEANKMMGTVKETGNSNILLIGTWALKEYSKMVDDELRNLITKNHKISTITFPSFIYQEKGNNLTKITNGGMHYTLLMDKTKIFQKTDVMVSFKISNILRDIRDNIFKETEIFPFEVHRKNVAEGVRGCVKGSFTIDDSLRAVQFLVYTCCPDDPGVADILLTDPRGITRSNKNEDLLSNYRILSHNNAFDEVGTYQYEIVYNNDVTENSVIQVLAAPKNLTAPLIQAKAWISNTSIPLTFYVQVERGSWPLLNADVTVKVQRLHNISFYATFVEEFQLFDRGSGGADLMKGDGVYSGHIDLRRHGNGLYMFHIIVSNNGEDAVSSPISLINRLGRAPLEFVNGCCGNVIPYETLENLPPFERYLEPITILFSENDEDNSKIMGRVTDLTAVILKEDLKAILKWTAPDVGGNSITGYDVRYSTSLSNISNYFESADEWISINKSIVRKTSVTFDIDFTRNLSLLGQTLFVAVRSQYFVKGVQVFGSPSNWVRIYIELPPAETTEFTYLHTTPLTPTIIENANFLKETISFFHHNFHFLHIMVFIALMFLLVLLFMYCCFFRKKSKKTSSKSNQHHNEKCISVASVPTVRGSTFSISSPILNSNGRLNVIDGHHHNGLLTESDDLQKRFSLSFCPNEIQKVNMAHEYYVEKPFNSSNLISSKGGLNRNNDNDNNINNSFFDSRSSSRDPFIITGNQTTNNQPTSNTLSRDKNLSPYQSWTASKLLHEHERRHSPYGQVQQHGYVVSSQINLPTDIYDCAQNAYQQQQRFPPNSPSYVANGFQKGSNNLHFLNSSLQGSLSSVSSGDKKRRNITMV